MPRQAATIVLICCLCIAMTGIAVADSESLRAANAIDTPEETISGTTITVNHIGVFEQGESIEATISGPDETYDVGLFDSSDTEIANQTGVSETVSFDGDDLNLSPGSYFLSVTNTAFEYVAPIVISGYDMDVELAENAAADELAITTTVTETAAQGPPHAVEAVVWNEDTERRIELTTDDAFSSSATYDGTVSIAEFDDESYEVYVVATSDDEIYRGENEILAVGEAPGDTQDDSDDETTGSGGSDGTTDGSDGSDGTSDSDDLSEPDSESDDETDESGSESDAENDDSSVIEPNTPSDDGSDGDTDDSSPPADDSEEDTDETTPLSAVIPIVAVLLTAFILRER